MTGTNPLTILSKMAPELLIIESIVIFLFLIFAMLSCWSMREDPAIILPRSRQTEWLMLGAMPVLWFTFSYLLGFDQVFFGLELTLAILLSTIHPGVSIGYFIVLLFLRPWEIAPPEQEVLLSALPRGIAFLSMATSFFYLLRSKQLNLRIGTPTVLLILFASWTFVSSFKASDPSAAQAAFFDIFFKAIILFLLITQAIRDQKAFRLTKGALIFAALGIASVAIYRTIMSHDPPGTRVGTFGLLADPNDVSAVMVMTFPFAFYFIQRRDPSIYLRFVCVLTIVVSLVLLYYAKSRGALLSLFVTICTMGFVNMKDKRKAVFLFLFSLVLFGPLTALFHRSADDTSASTDSRVIYWKAGFYMAAKSPLLGVGFNGYPENFEKYAPSIIESGLRTAHSTWILALAETGFPGFFLLLGLFAWTLKASWKVKDDYPELFFATVGYGCAASFLSHTYAIYLYLLIAIVFVGSRLSKEEEGAYL